MLRISNIFEARLGKKHLRRIYHYIEMSSGRGDSVEVTAMHKHLNFFIFLHLGLIDMTFCLRYQMRTVTLRVNLKKDQKVDNLNLYPTFLQELVDHHAVRFPQLTVSVSCQSSPYGASQANLHSTTVVPAAHWSRSSTSVSSLNIFWLCHCRSQRSVATMCQRSRSSSH